MPSKLLDALPDRLLAVHLLNAHLVMGEGGISSRIVNRSGGGGG